MPWRHGERRLVDDLIAGIELGHDEVAGRAVGEHAAGVGVVIGPDAGKAGQQAVVQVDDPPAGVLPAARRRQHAHVAGQDRCSRPRTRQQIASAARRRPRLRRRRCMSHGTPNCSASAAAGGPIADHHGRLGPDLAVANRPQQGQRRLGAIGGADRQPRPSRPARPATRRGPTAFSAGRSRPVRARISPSCSAGRSMRSSMANRLSSSWSYIWISAMFAPLPGHVVNDRIGQADDCRDRRR